MSLKRRDLLKLAPAGAIASLGAKAFGAQVASDASPHYVLACFQLVRFSAGLAESRGERICRTAGRLALS